MLSSRIASEDEESSIGPRGGPTKPPEDPEEFQRCGSDRDGDRPAPDGVALWGDPLQRTLAQTPAVHPESQLPRIPNPTLALEVMQRAVRRIAWGGDRQRGVAYIELGAGELEGATLTLEARGNAISLVVDLPRGASFAGLERRLVERLRMRGLEVESVQVR